MQWKNTLQSYGVIAKSFHWLMAVLVIGMLVVGLYMEDLPISPLKFKLYGWHKATGIVLLILVSFRLIWRVMNPVPLLPSNTPWYQRLAAHGVHALLYTMLFVMPLSGWLMSSSAGFPVSFFGWFTMPDLVGPDKAQMKLFGLIHYISALTLIGIIVMHIAASLMHHFYYRDTILRRMLPVVFLSFVGITSLISQASQAAPLLWKIDSSHSSLRFTAHQNHAKVNGSFPAWTAEVVFDPDDLAHSFVRATIDMTKIQSEYDQVATQLKGESWLHTDKYKQAVFTSEKFIVLKDGYRVDGTLWLRGVKKKVSLILTLNWQGKQNVTANAYTVIKRRDFNVGTGSWVATDVVEDDVRVDIHLVASK